MTLRNLDAMFRASSLLILGAAESPAQRQLMSNIAGSLPAGQHRQIFEQPAAAELPQADLAVVMRADWADAPSVDALVARGCKALLWAADAPPGIEVLQAARRHLLRVLGPRSAGLIHTGAHLNLSSLPLMPQPGTVAVIAQSQSVAAAALDWAVGRGVGLSWLAVTGAEADIDVADLLDHAALDPRTRAVVLQVGHIRGARKFMSAARAAARLKPVLVLQTCDFSVAGAAGSDPVRSAAFQRAGLVECTTLGGLFDGLAALELLPSLTGERIAVAGNGSGVCALATGAMLRAGMQPAALTADTRRQIALRIAQVRFAGGMDLGDAAASDVVATLNVVLADAGVDAALLVHSPMAGQTHQALASAIAEGEFGGRLLTVWLGQHSAQPARQTSAGVRVATFTGADEAVRAVQCRARYLITREMLRQTPPADAWPRMDAGAIGRMLAQLRARGPLLVPAAEAASVFAAYGLTGTPDIRAAARSIRITASLHAELGMVLGAQPESASRRSAMAYGLPPLDQLLARRMLADAGWAENTPADAVQAMAAALIRIGQLVVDQPLIRRLDLAFAWHPDGLHLALPDCALEIAGPDLSERQRLALAPYPIALAREATCRDGRKYQVRAVRPDDEPAVLRLLARLDPAEVRLRFFAYIRHFTHEMAARVTQVDYDREFTLVASSAAEPDEIVAMATLVADPDDRDAEYAVLVHHDHVRRGLGRHLLKRLLEIAHGRGIARVHGDVLAHNAPMLGLARSLGFAVAATPGDPGCWHVAIDSSPAV